MNINRTDILNGNQIEILELSLKKINNQLELSWKIYYENTIFLMRFYNVSRFRFGELSLPLELNGIEIIDNSQNGWEKDSKYEIRDFENDYVDFFCESYEIEADG